MNIFSVMQRSQYLDPHLYGDERLTTCHFMECSICWSFNSHTYFERLVCVDLARFSKDCLWLAYRSLKLVSVEPMYVFVPWIEDTSALYMMADSRHEPDSGQSLGTRQLHFVPISFRGVLLLARTPLLCLEISLSILGRQL